MKLQAFIATVIAVTAAAQADNPLHPGLQNWPPSNHYHQRLQPHFQEVESIAVQEENAEMGEMHAQPGVVQYRVSKSVGVESLTAGQIVEVQYVAPDSGRITVSLLADNGDAILTVDSRINWDSATNQYIFNSKANGEWGKEQIVLGFPFTCPPVPTTINVYTNCSFFLLVAMVSI